MSQEYPQHNNLPSSQVSWSFVSNNDNLLDDDDKSYLYSCASDKSWSVLGGSTQEISNSLNYGYQHNYDDNDNSTIVDSLKPEFAPSINNESTKDFLEDTFRYERRNPEDYVGHPTQKEYEDTGATSSMALMEIEDIPLNQVVLHEDKKYHPSAKEVYVRNIAIVGHVHHGKTSFVDMLIYETHNSGAWDVDKQIKSTIIIIYIGMLLIHILERDHGVNIKGMPITLVLQNTKEKSYPFNIPGHADFVDEATAELRLAGNAIKGGRQQGRSIKHLLYKSGSSYFHALLSQDNNKILNSRIRKNFFLKDNKNLVIKTMKIFDSDTSDNIKRGNSAISSCEITVVRMYKRSKNLLYEYMPQNIWRHNFILDSDNYFYANGKRFTKESVNFAMHATIIKGYESGFSYREWCNVNLWELILDQYFPDILDVEEVREESSS
ncbi:12432_t:CDS:10 [Entrophospora sp. SA101]|nr:12432_t:CDS:10 [Entrophospora sp. SA101]